MNHFRTLLVLLSVLVASCNQNSKRGHSNVNCDNLEVITVNTEQVQSLSFDEIVDSVYYIKLETPDNALIGYISSLFVTDSIIVVVDKFIANAVFLFNMDGKFRCRVSCKGNGPHEYLKLESVFMSPDNKQVVIYDPIRKHLLKFDLNGNWVQTVTPTVFGHEWGILDSNTIIAELWGNKCYPNPEEYWSHGFAAVDTLFQTKWLALNNKPEEIEEVTYIKKNTIKRFQNKTYFLPNMNDTVYEVTRAGLKARYYIDILPSGLLDHKFTTDEEYEKLFNDYFFFYDDFAELDDYTFIRLTGTSKTPLIMYSHKDKETYVCNKGYENPFFVYLREAMAVYGSNTLVDCYDANSVLSLKRSIPESMCEEPPLKALYEDITPNDNPILFFFRLKDL